MAHVIAALQKPTLVFCHNKTLAAQLARELRHFLGDNAVELFVSYYNTYIPESFKEASGKYTAKKASINENINALRHCATRSLMTRQDVVVVATVSCIYGMGLPEEYLEASEEWFVGKRFETESAVHESMGSLMYELAHSDEDFSPGTYQHTEYETFQQQFTTESSSSPQSAFVKITLWPPHEQFPSTITLEKRLKHSNESAPFQQHFLEVTRIEQGTQSGPATRSEMTIFPARHHVVSSDSLEEACRAIESELEERLVELRTTTPDHPNGNKEAAERLQKRVLNDLYLLRESGMCQGMENYSRHLTGRIAGEAPDTLLDYFTSRFGSDWLLAVDESHVSLPQLKAMYEGDQSRKRSLVKHGYRLPSALDNRPLREEEFWPQINQALFVSATPADHELALLAPHQKPVDMFIRPTHVCDPSIEVRSPDEVNQLQDLASEISSCVDKGERSLVLTFTKKDAEDLSSYLNEYGKNVDQSSSINATYLHSGLSTDERAKRLRMLQEGKLDVIVGINCLREGLDLPQVSLVAILDSDKEGFLRSERALLQIVGRAARHKTGKAIFYARRMTTSMQKCIDETNLRREKQIGYNKANGFEPKSTKGSTPLSLFDLLADQIEAEQRFEIFKDTSDTINSPTVISNARLNPTNGKELPTDHIPSSPGVYFWKDKNDRILYIGKAVKLRSRIKSYLNPGAKHSRRIKTMVEKAASVDFILTPSERDALALESYSIKQHQPPYNVLLKDDAHYPYICASVGDKLPKFSIVPHLPSGDDDDSRYRYFGPYTSYAEINSILEKIEEKYGLRTKSFLVRQQSGSSEEEYNELFNKALSEDFLSKSVSDLKALRSKYEEAGMLFDSPVNRCRDIVAVAPMPKSNEDVVIHVAQLRHGFVAGQFSYMCKVPSGILGDEEFGESIQAILQNRHYPAGREVCDPALSWFPDDILLCSKIPEPKTLRNTVRQYRKQVEPTRKGSIQVKHAAVRGEKALLDQKALAFATANAELYAQQKANEVLGIAPPVTTSVDGTAANQLAEMLSLPKPPSRIECYDISHLSGEETVGSRVVFIDGKPAKNLYRQFNIRSVEGIDDFASITEVLHRRFLRTQRENGDVEQSDGWTVPDLVVIDGGKGQLSAAMTGMEKAAPDLDVPICSLAKNKEEVFVPHNSEPLNDSPDSPALLLLRHLRDESHRFALSRHRRRRSVQKFDS